ncbi:transcriptional regulator [Pediococcus acidilactici]|nr:transcriptional regulator [Pediococcus acidilactici]UWF32909.1 transcriptional regulator [Pediococcus acidilactici]
MKASLTALEEIAHIRNSYLKKYCSEMAGTIADWKMVNYVNDARLTTLNLVELSGLDKSTVSRQLKHAAQHNFLQKHSNDSDQRKSTFTITDKGSTLKSYVNQQMAKFDQRLFDNWSEEESAMFQILINRVLKNALK